MKASVLFKQYVWLVDTIRRAGRITLNGINHHWLHTEMSEGIPYSRTTFRRRRQEVEEMFGIVIDCDNENRYYIDDPSLMNTDSVYRWMLHPTRDFLAYILSRGGWLQVISPDSIAQQIKEMLQSAEENYKLLP